MQQASATPPSRHRGLKIALAVVAIVVVAIAGLIAFALSDRGLSYIASRVSSHSGGRISVERPSGSLAGTMRFGRITWRGEDASLVADDVVVDWKPGALLGRHLLIRGLGARRVALAIKPSSNGATAPPNNLQLPLDVDIDRLAIGEFDWQAGPRSGRISGLEFGYSGNRNEHRIRDLTLVSDYGRVTGSLTVGAKAPLDVQGKIALDGAGTIDGAHADIVLTGPLAILDVSAKGAWRDTSLALTATATPFAHTPFSQASVDLTGLDAHAFDASLPTTQIGRAHV